MANLRLSLLPATLLSIVALLAGSRVSYADPSSPLGLDGSGLIARSMVSSSNSGGTSFTGQNIASIIDATTFYSHGFTGSGTIVANIEAGLVWDQHESLIGKVTQQLYDTNYTAGTQLGQYDAHATAVGQVIAGNGNSGYYQQGIAYGASLWSGAIATSWPNAPGSNGFTWSNNNTFVTPYATAMLTGVNGQKADVVNSSWGFADSTGNNVWTQALDGMARQSRTTVVFAAGNDGPDINTVNSPGAGFNSIVVGALGTDTGVSPYSTIASFSSRGPTDYAGPDTSASGVRARVDICAPGENLTLAYYGGTTGSNANGTDLTAGQGSFYRTNAAGTSYAAPIVAGSAALLCNAANVTFATDTARLANARDGEVIKAVLLNSATRPVGWDNGQTLVNGVVTTHQALDYTYGAGMLDLDNAYGQYLGGTTDVTNFAVNDLTGSMAATGLATIGWDYGTIADSGSASAYDYYFNTSLLGGSTFSATLNWFVDAQYDSVSSYGQIFAENLQFTNLDLQLWSVSGGAPSSMIAESNAAYTNTELFSLVLPETGDYMLRVAWAGERYDVKNTVSSQSFGLAWNGIASSSAPEPVTLALLAPMMALGYHGIRRRTRCRPAR